MDVGEISVAAGLDRLAPTLGAGATGIAGLQRLSGGASQELWRFDVPGPAGSRRFVLRRAPPGRVSDIGIGLATEARLIVAAGAGGVPVPPVVHILGDDDGLGQGFVMAFVDGETLGGRIARGEAFAAARTHLAFDCGTILARIHAVDPAALSGLAVRTPRDLVDEWGGLYRATTTPRPVFEAALRCLGAACPQPPAVPRLVHGDFRNGNLMVGPEGVRAVLDWELAHVGDPMEDIGWICVNSWRFGAIGRAVGGFGDLADLAAGYAAEAGIAIDLAAVRWWEVFGSLRWGIMCAGMPPVFRTVDPTPERAAIARRASETEIDLLRLMAA